MNRPTLTRRGIVSMVSLALLLAGGLQYTSSTRAAVASRRDPVFCISTPTATGSSTLKLQIIETISAASSQIAHVSYALEGPVGSKVTGVLTTAGLPAGSESYTYTADRTDTTIAAITTVTTTGAAVPVTINADVVNTSLKTTVTGSSNAGIKFMLLNYLSGNANWGS